MHGDVVEVAHHQHGPALERYSSESRQNNLTGLRRGKCFLWVRPMIFEVQESARHLAEPIAFGGPTDTRNAMPKSQGRRG